jgi:hypothetical protein
VLDVLLGARPTLLLPDALREFVTGCIELGCIELLTPLPGVLFDIAAALLPGTVTETPFVPLTGTPLVLVVGCVELLTPLPGVLVEVTPALPGTVTETPFPLFTGTPLVLAVGCIELGCIELFTPLPGVLLAGISRLLPGVLPPGATLVPLFVVVPFVVVLFETPADPLTPFPVVLFAAPVALALALPLRAVPLVPTPALVAPALGWAKMMGPSVTTVAKVVRTTTVEILLLTAFPPRFYGPELAGALVVPLLSF